VATAVPEVRTIAYLVQVKNGAGEWEDMGEIDVARSRSVHTVAETILHTRTTEHPERRLRVLAWDVWRVEQVTGCDPYPEDGYPSTQLAWVMAMRENVRPQADVTSSD
jgi:hypothetical protein